jgi:cellulose biosynthesis protein BcsQ
MHTPLNITLLAKKGGVGKTTTSILLYEVLRHAGKTVLVNDWDEQGTSSKALEQIEGKDRVLPAQPDIVIWDTPPNLDHVATATAVRSAKIALVVTSPAPVGIWEAEEAVQFVQGRNPNAAVRVVFNKLRKATVLGRLVEHSAQQVSVPVVPVMLNDRQCYQHMVAHGWKALDNAARQEALQFALALLSLTE